ncbi:isoprenoid synthase domain-containing protein [Rhypophila decipiens]|uniref:Isoprenoid synthase domain-containing protein n=1 Tax=Rhypophila decipiens TaxID=261697 RepID=A0AAN7B5D3_9PEZI|nr:isoprenoid synthase domain-containing protein [Rhypophila decipiens]
MYYEDRLANNSGCRMALDDLCRGSAKVPGGIDITAPWLHTVQVTDLSILHGLINAVKGWYQVPDLQARTIGSSVELIHISSLMLDDSASRLLLRQGRPAAHVVFGVERTVQSCKFMTIRGVKALEKLKNSRCMRVLLDEIVRKALTRNRKEIHPFTSAYNHCYPSIEDHIKALEKRSGSIIHLIKDLMTAASPLPSHKRPHSDHLIALFARLYAIRDDYANLPTLSTNFAPNLGLQAKVQSFYVALDEGKYSLLLRHALSVLPDDKAQLLKDMIVQRRVFGSFSEEHKPFVLEILRGCGSFEFVVGLIQRLQGAIFEDLVKLTLDRKGLPLDEAVYLTDDHSGYSVSPDLGYEVVWEREESVAVWA